jgi:predicted O-methyltransferase YrrM
MSGTRYPAQGFSDSEDMIVTEDAVLAAARARAAEVGCVPVSPEAGTALRLLTAALGARAVVEIGTGTGVSGVWLLRGMRPGGILTTVELEAEHQRLARLTFREAGATGRVRTILGRGLAVLPRLADASYDLVFCDAARVEYPDYLDEALRLLRPGGAIAFAGGTGLGRTADPTARDVETLALRELAKLLHSDDRLVSALVTGDVLVAVAP